MRVDTAVLSVLERFVPLMPLHQPHSLAPIPLLFGRAPELPSWMGASGSVANLVPLDEVCVQTQPVPTASRTR